MSTESARAFLDTLDSDAKLRAALFTAGNEQAERVSVSGERLAELGAQRGFAFTSEEIHEAFAERGGLTQGELGERDLDAVAGGTKFNDFVFVKHVDKSTPFLG